MTRSLTLLALFASSALAACAGSADGRTGKQSRATAKPAADTTDPRIQRADLARIMGDPSARVWMVIASDFQCPYCKMWHDSSSATIINEYVKTGRIRLAYINYPIQSHLNGATSAEAAMCAGAQGKFWEYGDRLFATQQEWAEQENPQPAFHRQAVSVGLDTTAFAACIRDHVMLPMVSADRRRGRDSGVKGTPTFFIGRHVIDQAMPASAFRPVIDSALAEAGRAEGTAKKP